jgi:hypothetical protein
MFRHDGRKIFREMKRAQQADSYREKCELKVTDIL